MLREDLWAATGFLFPLLWAALLAALGADPLTLAAFLGVYLTLGIVLRDLDQTPWHVDSRPFSWDEVRHVPCPAPGCGRKLLMVADADAYRCTRGGERRGHHWSGVVLASRGLAPPAAAALPLVVGRSFPPVPKRAAA